LYIKKHHTLLKLNYIELKGGQSIDVEAVIPGEQNEACAAATTKDTVAAGGSGMLFINYSIAFV